MLALHQDEKLEIYFEIDIAASPAKVWQQLASAEGMSQWLSRSLEFEFKVGGKFRMEVNMESGHWIFFGLVQTIESERELAFTWTQREVGKQPWPVSTLVRFTLTETEEGTRVQLRHSGFEALDKAIANDEYRDHILGWKSAAPLEDLKQVVEQSN